MDNTDRIKILLADDHEITREGLCLLFKGQPDIEVLGETEVSETLVQLVCELRPDVVVIDFNMYRTENTELIRQIINKTSGIRIVAFSTQLHTHIIEQAIKAGFSGFVLKECCFSELVYAIKAVHTNKTYMCPKLRDTFAKEYISRMQKADCRLESSALTERECEIIRLLSLGITSKQIATRLHVSPKTIDASRRKIMDKLGIYSMAELVKHAIRVGLATV